tara:strand:+ start:68 stop:250 length:183 start_codon:yes stop_codon:yes gene_type:complete
MDVQMREMDGFEATRQIIAKWGDARPRIVALTANAMREDKRVVSKLGWTATRLSHISPLS